MQLPTRSPFPTHPLHPQARNNHQAYTLQTVTLLTERLVGGDAHVLKHAEICLVTKEVVSIRGLRNEDI